MPGRNPILAHWQKEVAGFNKNFASLEKRITADAIHDLRVAIKKLRSYSKLCTALSGHDTVEKKLAGIRQIFSVLGRHRNIEVSRNLVLAMAGSHRPALDPLLVHFQVMQDEVADYCRDALKEYSPGSLEEMTVSVREAVGGLTHDDIIKKVKDVTDSSMTTVKHNLKHFLERSHLIRKDLKNIYYWAKVFEKDELLTKNELRLTDKILTHLGDIQDHEILTRNLKTFRRMIIAKGLPLFDLIRETESEAKKKKDELLDEAEMLTTELVETQKAEL